MHADNANLPIRPGHPSWPRVWTTYHPLKSREEDFAALRAASVGNVSYSARTADEARAAIELARRTGMTYHLHLPDITEQRGLVAQAGLTPEPALLIGGVYRGKALDRHLFTFAAGPQRIVIEPPVYNQGFAYTRGSGPVGTPLAAEKIAHYFPDMGAPCRAEVVVPLRAYDGRQHLEIIPAEIAEVPGSTPLEADSVGPDLPPSRETAQRRLFALTFDLSRFAGAQLDRVGLAVYWEYHGTPQYWMFGRGNVSSRAESTRQALRAEVRKALAPWSAANGGRFPLDAVLALRFGDECFYVTSHLNGPSVSLPLWEYSASSVAAFRAHAGDLAYPRTWGFPEVYGPDAYAEWLYGLHEGCAALCGVVRDEVARLTPGLLVFRNQTRMGVFDLINDHDGTGQELLTRNLDFVHLDPYPVEGRGYNAVIPRDMSYCAGLARRYARPLVPWMQAHTYGGAAGLQHVSPADVERMAREQWAQGPDAVMWLGYGKGFTFPETRPDSWQRAVDWHRRWSEAPPPKPVARLGVLRPYRVWALSSLCDGLVRNPADWLLRQLLEVWAVRHGQPYDVFELPPRMSAEEKDALAASLKRYPFLVSTEPYPGAWVLGENTASTAVDPATAPQVQTEFEEELRRRGWLTR